MRVFHPMAVEGELPKQLNNPFDYEPHPLCVEAARIVCEHLQGGTLWDEVMLGKMLGVLVCQRSDGTVGFLAAYSGQLGGREDWPWFVPAVFDYLQPDGYFKQEEARISAINADIALREQSAAFTGLKETLLRQQQQAEQEIEAFRQQMAEKKRLRDEIRRKKLQTPPPTPPLGGEGNAAEVLSLGGEGNAADEATLIRESQYQKAELRRLKERWRNTIAETEAMLRPLQDEIARLRQERRQRSDALQRWLFDQFVMLNEHGEQRTLTDIFASTPQRVPPAGTGECCAPKLLQYAFAHGLRPLCMAEFWQGASPKMEVRHHGSFYPACRGKCKPVLEWMLASGSAVASPTTEASEASMMKIGVSSKTLLMRFRHCRDLLYVCPQKREKSDIHKVSPYSSFTADLMMVFEDDSLLVVDKPAGMLSVPGKTGEASVESLLRARYGEVFMVHRLDQDTSGLMVVARNREAHRLLQQQFHARVIYKMYIALLDGTVDGSGTINLPLRPDIDDRPRQMVDHEHGKEAITDYEVLGHENGYTRVALTPHTGRTHQLRMHCAHHEGLGVPIVGDRLYGRGTAKGQRLCLHAAALSFIHPQTRQRLTFNSDPPF